jgi:regulator of nonsense transcripts 2
MCFDRGGQKKKLDNFLTFFQVPLLNCFGRTAHCYMVRQYYVHCKEALPLDVDFMYSDSLEVSNTLSRRPGAELPVKAVRPRLELAKTIEEAANAVDDMFNSAFQSTGK